MKWDFLVLGATGLQGRIAARDLLENGYSVLLCGRNKGRINDILNKYKKTKFEYVDLENYNSAVNTIKKSGASVVLNCAEGDWNLAALKACIECRAHNLDLGSEIPMTKEQLGMHNQLIKKEITHITGCGSVPGIGNVMLNHAANDFDTINSIDVGFSWNSNIKKFVVPFSMPSIVDEFTAPATNVKNGHFVKIEPMSSLTEGKDKFVGDEKLIFVRHPETYTFYKYYKNKGVKNIRFFAGFPPHSFNRINSLIELGLTSYDEVNYKGIKIVPMEFVNEVLKNLPIPKGYTEKEDLWVTLIGKKDGKIKKVAMKCIVPTLKGWESAGCNIDTGMTVSIMAQMIKNGTIKERGSFAPEAIIPPEPFFKELAKRKMVVYKNGKKIN